MSAYTSAAAKEFAIIVVGAQLPFLRTRELESIMRGIIGSAAAIIHPYPQIWACRLSGSPQLLVCRAIMLTRFARSSIAIMPPSRTRIASTPMFLARAASSIPVKD